MFAQLGAVQFSGLQTFVSFSTGEEVTLAEFALIGRKPRLMGAGIGLVTINLSIFLHVEFTPGSIDDEVEKIRASKDNFEILPLVWGNGETAGEFVIKEMDVEYTNLDALGNKYEARVNLSLVESVEDNKALQEQQAAAKNAFASGNIQPATRSKRKNPASCPKKIASLIQEIQQFGNVVNQVVTVYTGDQKQADTVGRACSSISEDCQAIEDAANTVGSCIYQNTRLQGQAQRVHTTAASLGADIVTNAKVVNGIEVAGRVPDGVAISTENSGLQVLIKGLVFDAQSIIKTAAVQ